MLFLVDTVLVTVFILPLILLKTSTNSLFSFAVMLSVKGIQKQNPILVNETFTFKIILMFCLCLLSNIDVLFMSLK